MGNGAVLDQAAVHRGAVSVLQILAEFESASTFAECRLEDARRLSVETASMDAVITSPPYINVFNYHQYYRPAAELLGWRPLEAASSEIGANRKHRVNRFLTVVQYCLDMSLCIDEFARTLRTGAPLIIILGRTSNVLGTAFRNGLIFRELLALSNNFGPVHSAHRVFTNRFGEQIFEDILIAHRERAEGTDLAAACKIARSHLVAASDSVPRKNRTAHEEAIARAGEIRPSPFLKLFVPPSFRCATSS
jgi:hypothetical protein